MKSRVIYSAQAVSDLERLTDFLSADDPVVALETVGLIEEAVTVLRRHPLVGRPAESGLRELVISRGRTGYLALYDFDAVREIALVLAIRHQREAGYRDPTAD